MREPRFQLLERHSSAVSAFGRLALIALALSAVAAAGLWMGHAEAYPSLVEALQAQVEYNTLRVHGYPIVSNPREPAFSNRPATAGSNASTDPNTGQVPEDPPYSALSGPFDPLSAEAPEMDFVTWNPVWISERLDDPDLRAAWPGLVGEDEVSRAARIRAGSIDASEKVWLRHWYEPQHLDKDLNADGRLTDADNNGVPDAPVNPRATSIDEWYPAVVTEVTYMLVENDPLPVPSADPSDLRQSAPLPVCGRAGGTQLVFPIGVASSELDPAGPVIGYGLTSLDADFDGEIDSVRVTDEATLPSQIGGAQIDFDGDNQLDTIDSDGAALSCDEMVVLHTDALTVGIDERIQFLDHFLRLVSVTDSAAVVEVWHNGDVLPRMMQRRSIGIDGVLLAGDGGPLQAIAPGGNNLGSVPTGAWFAYLQDADPTDGEAVLILGRALGAPCASMEFGPNRTNRSTGGPAFLKRFYVDGHEYNTVAIGSCSRTEFQYITLRAPLPKVPVTIEQHSVRLQPYAVQSPLALPPPFNYEHTVLEDILAFEDFENVHVPPNLVPPFVPRPTVRYMGGPVGPVAPVLGSGDPLPYTGRNPADPVGPYNDVRSTRWFYVDEDTNPQMLGQLKEKYGAQRPGAGQPPDQYSAFYNEQVWTLPWNFTEFALPDLPDPGGAPQTYDIDKYYVTSAFSAPTARWRRWTMPDGPVPAFAPPLPPDLTTNNTPDGDRPLGAPRRATFWFDPDDPANRPTKLWTDETGVRLFGGQPERADFPCDRRRPAVQFSAGDRRVTTDVTSVALGDEYPVEVRPYTDPWAPFNPQHEHAPRADSLTVNPAYMDEFRNYNEDLQALYSQLSIDEQNAREKVYHRLWYEPVYTSKIRYPDDCERDVRFPALMQEFTYLYVDTTDNPLAAPPGRSRFGFPIGTAADELPVPAPGGTLPPGGQFGHGLTTFDANFDGLPDAVTVHSERTLAAYLDTQWQSHRPSLPGFPPPPVPGPVLDFDGDGILDNLDADARQLNGNELVVFAVESLTLDLDPATPSGSSAMILDHLVTLENVTRGARAQFRFWFTGGNATDARPEPIGGVRSLQIGDAAIADRFQSRVTVISPGEINPGTDGAWFVFLDDVSSDDDRVTVTVGRALGATHSAIDNGAGGHDLLPGDPWYLKRFYVDGHEYNVVAIMTQAGRPGQNDLFEFISIRTPVPKGSVLNAQDSLLLQGYYLGDLPDQTSVMPPFNTDHTIAVDIERLTADQFANTRLYGPCVGQLSAFGPLAETIVAEDMEPRLGVEIEEINRRSRLDWRWQTDQSIVIPNQYTDLAVSPGQQYLYTSNWTSPVSRLHFYGCLRILPPPFPSGVPGLTHEQLANLAAAWSPPAPRNIVPAPNQLNPPQPVPPLVPPGEPPIYARHYDARLGGPDVRVKLFYDPTDSNDIYFNRRRISEVPTPTPTPSPSGTRPTSTSTVTSTPTFTPTPTGSVATSTATVTLTPTPVAAGAPLRASCTVIAPFRIRVDWTDNSTYETEFIIDVSVNGSPFAPIDTVASTTTATTGTPYSWTTPVDLAANTGYRFRVTARNPGSGQTSPPSNLTSECRTQSLAENMVGCYKGRVYLQGRSDHSGTLIYVDGIPMAYTDHQGEFCICDILPGTHTISTASACYLRTEARNVHVPAGMTTVMPYTALRGGDVNNDDTVNLFDLVRVGADYRSSPPNDPEADCTLDNRVDLFDLVMVGSNYGVNAPVPWGYHLATAQGASPAPAGQPAAPFEIQPHGLPGDTPVTLQARTLEEGEITVDITVSRVRDLYAAELRLSFDPARLQVVDASEAPGVQIEPGAPWNADGTSFIKPNQVDNDAGTILFAASRMNPAPALNGDAVLARVTFRTLDGPAEDAYALSSVLLLDRWAREIEVRWEGVDIEPVHDLTNLTKTIHLPYAANNEP